MRDESLAGERVEVDCGPEEWGILEQWFREGRG